MADEPYDGSAVLKGGAGRDLVWVVSVDASDGSLLVMLNLFRRDRYVSGTGFASGRSFGGTVLQSSRGHADGLPWHVLARTGASVTRAVATTDRGTEVELTLSPLIAEYGSRFAAAVMPEGECPCEVRVERDGVVLDAGPQHRWPCPPTVGW